MKTIGRNTISDKTDHNYIGEVKKTNHKRTIQKKVKKWKKKKKVLSLSDTTGPTLSHQ